jgi:hypothetical protein
MNVVAFIASERSELRDVAGEMGYANRRAAAWWGFREMLDPASGHDVAIPPDDVLTGDLTAPKYRVLSGGKILVEAKVDIKNRIGRSTDAADAVIQAFVADEPAEPDYTGFVQINTRGKLPSVRTNGRIYR